MREEYESGLRARLQALRHEYEDLSHRVARAETAFELEYYTRLEELQLAIESAEQKFELLLEVHEDQWERIRDEIEQVWKSARELIRTVTSP